MFNSGFQETFDRSANAILSDEMVTIGEHVIYIRVGERFKRLFAGKTGPANDLQWPFVAAKPKVETGIIAHPHTAHPHAHLTHRYCPLFSCYQYKCLPPETSPACLTVFQPRLLRLLFSSQSKLTINKISQ